MKIQNRKLGFQPLLLGPYRQRLTSHLFSEGNVGQGI